MRKILIADKQDITRLGIAYILNSIASGHPFVEVNKKAEIIALLSTQADALIILDYSLFDINNVNELLILQDRFPQSNWILFSEELNDDFLKSIVYNNQAFSIVLKSCPVDEINSAILSALKGERFICNRIANQLLNVNNKTAFNKTDSWLTITEKEILKEIALGKTTKEIASERNLSFHTIITHRKNIFRKLDVNNIHEATRYAMRAGIIDVADYYI